jgi:protein O-GlcNAc transferase
VTRANYLAHNNLGVALATQGKAEAAIEHYREALRIKPDYDHARSNLAETLRARYEQAVAANPTDATAHYDLAIVLRDGGHLREASERFEQAIELRPDYATARRDLGGVLVEMGQMQAAVQQYEAAIRLAPNDPAAHFNFGSTLVRMQRLAEAIEQYRFVVTLTPDDAEAWGSLAMVYAMDHQPSAAAEARQKAVALARANGRWALVQSLDDWFSSYQSGRVDPLPAS